MCRCAGEGCNIHIYITEPPGAVRFQIHPADELPIYRQIVRQVVDAVAGGRLKPGDKLPAHRELAEQIVVAPLTVKKAYDELEREGTITTQRGLGTFIRTKPRAVPQEEKLERPRIAARTLLAAAWLSGVAFEKLLEILKKEEARLDAERAQSASKDEAR